MEIMSTVIKHPLKRLDLTSLRLFITVCDEGSIGKAAEKEFIVASAISKRISDLEAEVGASLLYRSKRGVRPSPAGETLLHHAKAILRSIERMAAELSDYSDGIRGHVRILANISAITQFLPEDLSRFSNKYRDVKIDLEEQVSNAVVKGVEDASAEIGICTGTVPTRDLQVIPYRSDRLVVSMRPEHPLASLNEITYQDVLEFDQIGLKSSSALSEQLRKAGTDLGRAASLRIQVTSFDAVCRMVQANMGIAVLPESAALPYVNVLGIVCRPLLEPWAARQLIIVVRDKESLPLSSKALLEELIAKPAQLNGNHVISENVKVVSGRK
jgi:DNA-binding transcriptional LysR family regulator